MKLSSADICHVLLQGAPSGSKLKRPTFHSSRGSLTGENGGTTHTSKPSRTGETPAMCPGYCRHVICFIKEDLLIASSIFLFINSISFAWLTVQSKPLSLLRLTRRFDCKVGGASLLACRAGFKIPVTNRRQRMCKFTALLLLRYLLSDNWIQFYS